MANRTTLLNTDDNEYFEEHVDQGKYAANYSIPVLWPALFDIEDIRIKIADDDDDDETYEIPYLITSLQKAKENFLSRKKFLMENLSPVGIKGITEMESILNGFSQNNIILDTWELWMMEPDDFDEYLKFLIAATKGDDIKFLLEQSFVSDTEDELHFYIGYEWNTE